MNFIRNFIDQIIVLHAENEWNGGMATFYCHVIWYWYVKLMLVFFIILFAFLIVFTFISCNNFFALLNWNYNSKTKFVCVDDSLEVSFDYDKCIVRK